VFDYIYIKKREIECEKKREREKMPATHERQ